MLSGLSLRRIASSVGGASAWSIRRHKPHVAKELVSGAEAAATDSLLARVELLVGRLHHIASMAEARRDWAPAVAALREVRESLTLLGRLGGELNGVSQVQVNQQINIGITSDDPPDVEISKLIAACTDNFSEEKLAYFRELAAANDVKLLEG